MASSTKTVDPAFQGAGQKPGLEIWRIENFQPVPLPKSDYGKFYMGDSYIVLQTTPSKGSGGNLLDIHFWIGRDTSQDEKGTAAIKTVELDAALGARAVQHRELQGHESDKFLSYFKPCMVPLEGGIASGFKTPEEEVFESRLYTCKGTRVVRMKQVPCARSSLNHDDVFILDSEEKIYQFNGANSSIQERAKALEAIQFLKEKYHKGTCDVAIVDDGKLDTDSDSGEFWVLLGGYAPIGKKVVSEDDVALERTPAKLYSINDGAVNIMERELSKGLLEKDKCYLLDCGSEVFVWVGRATQVEKRKAACQAAEDFLVRENRPEHTHITRLIQGYETHSFKSNFSSWTAESTTSSSEEGKGKVAALLAKQGVVKGMKKNAAVNEEVPPLLEGGGKIEAWCINGSDKTPLPEDDIGKFYCGDCYIILYTYHLAEKKDNYYLCCWLGTDSLEEDRKTAIRLATAMTNSLKGRPVQGRIFQGKEPPQFIALFQPMVVLKGGLSSGYKETIAAQGLPDETYTPDCVALFEISGTSVHNNKAIQIEAVATSLNSTKGFLLQAGSSMFTWLGKQSTYEQKQLAAKVSEFLKPGVAIKHANEGTESSSFWLAIGGKKVYVSKKVTSEVVRDPHLFTYSINEGKFRVDEVHNFSQDDLLTEDMMILDTHAEVFIWVGQSVDAKEKQSAFDIGQRYIELAASLEDSSPNVALFKVTEGNEPSFFTANFSWDPEKANVQGNSFQRKASLLGFLHSFGEEKFSANNGGATQRAAALAALNSALNSSSEKQPSQEKSNESSQGGPRQRAEALAALNSALNAAPPPKPSVSRGGQGTQRTAAVAALSSFMSADKQKRPGASPSRSPPPEANPSDEDASDVKETGNVSENDVEQEEDSFYASIDTFYSYDQLKAHSENPITTGIDSKRREAYLSNEDFKTIFGVTKGRFSKMPKWKQDMLKKKFNLF